MPLIPIPPMPTKWMRRVRPSITLRPLGPARGRARRSPAAASGCASSCAAATSPPRLAASARERRDAVRRAVAGQLALLDQLRRPGRDEDLGIDPLVIVGRGRQRNEDRRPGRRGQLGDRGGARTADDQIGELHLASHVEDERFDPRREPGAAVAVPDGLEVALSCLMRDLQPEAACCQPRRCLHHGHVDRVRALGAAKDQDSRRAIDPLCRNVEELRTNRPRVSGSPAISSPGRDSACWWRRSACSATSRTCTASSPAACTGRVKIYAAELRERVAALGLTGRVHFTGFRPDIPDLMNAWMSLFTPRYARSRSAA